MKEKAESNRRSPGLSQRHIQRLQGFSDALASDDPVPMTFKGRIKAARASTTEKKIIILGKIATLKAQMRRNRRMQAV